MRSRPSAGIFLGKTIRSSFFKQGLSLAFNLVQRLYIPVLILFVFMLLSLRKTVYSRRFNGYQDFLFVLYKQRVKLVF